MAMMKSTFFLFAVLLFATNTHAVKLTIEVDAPTPGATMPHKPPVTMPPKPCLTMPPKPAVTMPPKPSWTMPPKPSVTMPPKPSVAKPPKPAVTMPPKPSRTMPPKPAVTMPPKPSVAKPPKPAVTMPPKPSVAKPPKPAVTMPPKPSRTMPPKPSVTMPPKRSVTKPPKPAVTLTPKPSVTKPPKPSGALPPMGMAKPPTPDAKSAAAQVEVVCQNEAKRAVTITAPQMKKAKEVSVEAGQWELVGVYEVSANVNEEVLLTITVTNELNVAVKKTLVLNLLQMFENELEGTKLVVLDAVEETKEGFWGKEEQLLKILMDFQVVVEFNLSL